MKPLPADCLPIFDRVVIADYTPRPAVEEVTQMLGFDPADVVSISITPDEVQVITRASESGPDDGFTVRQTRTLHRSVIR